MRSMRALLLAYALGASGAAGAADLLDVYRLAVESDPQLRQSEAALHAVEATKGQARAQLLPQLNASANLNRQRQEITESRSTFYPPTTLFSTTKAYSLNLNQALYHRAYFTQIAQADAAIGQARTTYDAERQNLIVRAAQAYFNVLAAADDLEFARAEKETNLRLLDQTKQRFDVGLVAITDVHESQAASDLAAARAITAETRLTVAQEELRELTGRAPGELARPRSDVPLVEPEPANVEAWREAAAKQNLPLLAAQFAVEAARQNLELQRAGHYPTLDATASYGYRDVSAGLFGGSVSNDTIIGLQLTVPIYQGGGVDARARESRFRLAQSQEALEQQRRATDRATRSAYLTVLDNINNVRASKQALVSNETALEATQAGYEVGTRTLVDVVQSQRNLSDARRTYTRARYDYILSSLQLKAAAGLLDVQDLEQINGWLH